MPLHHPAHAIPHTDPSPPQAASAMESLKMESPVKKLDLTAGKENLPVDAQVEDIEVPKAVQETKEVAKPAVAPTIKPEEADEPLLQENPQRFVLFPIKYHEVSDAPGRV